MRIDDNAALLDSLKQALRYIEVSVAYRGAMTAPQVEAAILENKKVTTVQIGANSCNTLATFRLAEARALVARADAARPTKKQTWSLKMSLDQARRIVSDDHYAEIFRMCDGRAQLDAVSPDDLRGALRELGEMEHEICDHHRNKIILVVAMAYKIVRDSAPPRR